MEFVYVVFGATGEYSDYTEWTVRAFETEEEAIKLVDQLKELSKNTSIYDYPIDKNQELYFIDPDFKCYDSVSYSYGKIPFGDLKYFVDKSDSSC